MVKFLLFFPLDLDEYLMVIRSEVLSSILAVEGRLGEWLKSNETLAEAETNLQDGHHLMAMLKVTTFLSLSCFRDIIKIG